MENTCDILADLLPLYLDGVCGEASRALVEDHLQTCPACRELAEALRAEPARAPVPPTKEAEVLKRTAQHMDRRAILRAAGVTAIVLYWLVYLWQDSLANQGNYRYFSYSFHEIYTAGILLVPLLTLIWLVRTLFRTIKGRAWRRDAALVLVLALLLSGQLGYQYQESQKVHVDSWTEVVSIPDPYHIVIDSSRGPVTLATEPIVTALLRTDGTIYGFSYESDLRTPDQGRLNGVWDLAAKDAAN